MLALMIGCHAGNDDKSKIWWWSKSKHKSKGKGKEEAIVHHYHHYVKGAHRPPGKRYVIVIPFKMNSPGYDQSYDWDSASYKHKQHGGYHKSKGFFKHRSSQSEEPENLPLSSQPHHPTVSTAPSDQFQMQLQKQLAKLSASNQPPLRRNGADAAEAGMDLINITPMIRQNAAKQHIQVQQGQRRRVSRFQ